MHFHKTRFADWARRYKHAAVKLGHSTADDAGLADHGDQALEGEVVSNTPFIQTVQAVCCFVVHGSHIILVSRGRNLVPFTDRRATITRGALASARAEWTASLLPTYGQRWMRSPGVPTMPTQPSDLKAHYVREQAAGRVLTGRPARLCTCHPLRRFIEEALHRSPDKSVLTCSVAQLLSFGITAGTVEPGDHIEVNGVIFIAAPAIGNGTQFRKTRDSVALSLYRALQATFFSSCGFLGRSPSLSLIHI